MASSSNKAFIVIALVITVGVLAVLFQPAVKEQLAPELVAAWVGIEVNGSGVAEVGPVALAADTPFRLHAVVEARQRGGEPLYYTAAPALRFAGGEAVPAARLRPWDRPRPARVRWFTVEGERPFVELDAQSGVADFTFQEFLRSDWPVSWSIPGDVDAANDNHLARDSPLERQLFGTQRYHVRLELYDHDDDLIPKQVIRSWGVAEIKAEIARFPTVRLAAPGRLGPASLVFGLSQLAPPAGAEGELLARVDELARHGLAFSRATVLRDQLAGAGRRYDELTWQRLDLASGAPWGTVAAGDLLRVADRVVVLYEDRGAAGVVDYGDLCFDFVQGAAVRSLSDIFTGGSQIVEWASLGGGGASATKEPG